MAAAVDIHNKSQSNADCVDDGQKQAKCIRMQNWPPKSAQMRIYQPAKNSRCVFSLHRNERKKKERNNRTERHE